MKRAVLIFIMLVSVVSIAQKKTEEVVKQAELLTSQAAVAMANDEFVEGEAKYRKAIARSPEKVTGKYNLGNAYYKENKNGEAMKRYLQAVEVANSKSDKHRAFHNLGNTFMNDKMYKEAVEAYKNALRNNPTDDETRYNLALAKEMLEKENQNNGGGEDDKEEDEKDKKEEDQEEDKKEGDQGEDEKDKGEEEEKEKEGDQKEEQGDPDKPKEQEQEQKKPQQGQLSPQQIKSLLEAMNNEEQKVQEKVNAKKEKGAKTKTGKDW
ncbi:MAG: tetratricopeptide repeat protein [Gilvibacter sp.]